MPTAATRCRRAFLLKSFLTDAECDHIIAEAAPTMVKSAVADNVTGKSKPSDVRTSTGTLTQANKRFCDWKCTQRAKERGSRTVKGDISAEKIEALFAAAKKAQRDARRLAS